VHLGRTYRFGSEHNEQDSVRYGDTFGAGHDDHKGLCSAFTVVTHHHHHHHLWLTPLRVRSTTGCQQPPEWLVLGQVDCVGP